MRSAVRRACFCPSLGLAGAERFLGTVCERQVTGESRFGGERGGGHLDGTKRQALVLPRADGLCRPGMQLRRTRGMSGRRAQKRALSFPKRFRSAKNGSFRLAPHRKGCPFARTMVNKLRRRRALHSLRKRKQHTFFLKYVGIRSCAISLAVFQILDFSGNLSCNIYAACRGVGQGMCDSASIAYNIQTLMTGHQVMIQLHLHIVEFHLNTIQ